MSISFNLVDEHWIPVLYHDGRWDRVGIQTAFEDAGRIRQIAASNPMDRLAILRFLLAILYWCKGNPPERMAEGPGDSFPPDWFVKLDENRECFELFGDGKRFYQNDAYKSMTPEHTVNYLIHEVPSGTNKWHFRHSTDKTNGLCPHCCAMGLLRLPVFATSGGKGMTADSGKSPGINAKPPLYVLEMGSTLAATLRLSWRKTDMAMGTPEWETPNVQLSKVGEVPLLTGMTWLPRNIWLGDPEESESECILCGRTTRVIRRCVFDGKGSAKAEARIWRDPHVVYLTSAKGDVVSLYPGDALGNSDSASGQWARIIAGILQSGTDGEKKDAWIVGFSTVQNDKYLEAMEFTAPIPSSADQIRQSIEKIERWRKEGSNLFRKVVGTNKKKSSRKHVEIRPMVDAIRPHVEECVFTNVGELLSGGDAAWARATHEYQPMMEMIAKSLSPGFTTAALVRRREIARVTPDMQEKKKEPKKPVSKKGGDT